MSSLWILVCVIAIVVLQAALFSGSNFKKISYKRYFSKNSAFIGDKVEMVEVILNDKLMPVPWVRMEAHMSQHLRFKSQKNLEINQDQYHKSIFSLMPYKEIVRRHEVTCMHRGVYNLNTVTMTAGDLLGLRERHKTLDVDTTLVVYPLILDISEMPEPSRQWYGDVTVRRWIMPDPFLVNGIRDYRAGDPMRDIHWGATARMAKLQVKTRDFTTSPEVLILLNVQAKENLWGDMNREERELIEKGINYCATLASWAVSSGVKVGFGSNGNFDESISGNRIESGCSSGHMNMLLEALARFSIERREGFHITMQREEDAGTSGLDIVLVSAYWTESLDKHANALRAAGNTVTIIPIEKDPAHDEEEEASA